MMPAIRFILLLSLAGMAAHAAQSIPSDSTRSNDSARVAHRINRSVPILSLSDSDLRWLDYSSLASLARYAPGLRSYELGTFGHPIGITTGGAMSPWWSCALGTESTNDPVTSRPEPYLIPTEACDSFLVEPQHRSFLHGGNGSLISIQAFEKEENFERPHSAIRHTEAPYNYLFTDASFSVNPADSMNVSFGITRHSQSSGYFSTGSLNTKLPSSGYDAWNIRTKYRFDMRDGTRIVFKYTYDHHLTSHNGGIAATSYGDEEAAFGIAPVLFNTTMRSEFERNRIEARMRTHFLADTTNPTRISLSYTTHFDKYIDQATTTAPTIPIRHSILTAETVNQLYVPTRWKRIELQLHQVATTSWIGLEFGGSLNRISVSLNPYIEDRSAWNTSLWGKVSADFSNSCTEFFLRHENNFGKSSFGFGATETFALNGNAALWFGTSLSERAPSLAERASTSPRVVRASELVNSAATLGEIGIRLPMENFDLTVTGFFRSIARPVITSFDASDADQKQRLISTLRQGGDGEHLDDAGVSGAINIHLWKFHLETRPSFVMHVRNDLGIEQTKNEFFGSADLYYRNVVLNGALDLKAGARASFSLATYPLGFNPETGSFGASSNRSSSSAVWEKFYTEGTTLDLYIFAKVRTATIHVIVENALDARYVTTAFYPMAERSIRFGVTWDFFD